MTITETDWGSSSKIEARRATIIEPYTQHFKTNKIPTEAQYWTMCGRCATPEGKLVENCEMDFLVKEKFINPDQFHGVEFNEQTNKDNSQLKYGNFYHGMMQFHISKAQSPAIINFDHHQSIDTIKGQIICLTENIKHHSNFLLTINILKKYRTVNDSIEYIANNLLSIDNLCFYDTLGWYTYNGVLDCETTEMVSFMFVKGNQ